MSDVGKIVKQRGTGRLARSLLSVAVGLLLAGFLAALYVTDGIQVQQCRSNTGLTRIEEDTCRIIRRADAPIGIVKEYTFTISETISDDLYLAFYTVHQYADVWLDGQQVYSLAPSGEKRISKTVGSNWVAVPICREDAGKEVRVEITPVYESFRDREVEFLIGYQYDIVIDRLIQDLPQLILGIVAVFVGFVYLCMAGSSLFKKPYGRELANLGMFSAMMGLWRLTDTRFTPMLLPDRPVFLFYISVAMLMIGTIPLVRAMEERFHKISRRIFTIYCVTAELICIVQICLQLFGAMDLRDNLIVTHMVILTGVLVIIGNVIFERCRYPQEHKETVPGRIPFICITGVLADVVAFYVRGTSSGLLFSLLSLLIYIVYAGMRILFRYSRQEKQLAEKDRQLAEKERQLTENRIATMISQIQPHFIYNTLGTIGQFCLDDPKKAADLIQIFTMYLRGNFVELENDVPIRLSKEMEHVRYYADIELIRFPDMQVIYDLKAEDFLIPALTVQPLVENAIKHGLMGLESGGIVTISTYETEQNYCVCVEDNGVGFDDSVFRDGRKHIGIQNIRGRLEAMVGGTLTIDSIPGKGTTALILIPKEGVK